MEKGSGSEVLSMGISVKRVHKRWMCNSGIGGKRLKKSKMVPEATLKIYVNNLGLN